MLQTVEFTRERIVIPPVRLPSLEIGACVEFQGIVRETEHGEKLGGLWYDAYLPMAETLLRRIFDSLANERPSASVEFIHRLGWVPVGEASLYLRVFAKHRGEALRFCGDAIDRMKADVPIWKGAAPSRE